MARAYPRWKLDHPPLDPGDPIPFEAVLLPAIAAARRMLCLGLNVEAEPLRFPLLGVLSEPAYRQLERGLLRQLGLLSAESLHREFRRGMPYGESLLARLDANQTGRSSDRHYRRFCRQQLRNGLSQIFRDYPVLGRRLGTAVIFWVEATGEFLQRLAADQRDLEEVFQLTGPLHVAAVEGSLSDRHQRGRSVIALELTSGEKLVYKPKPLSLESAFNDLLSWCNARESPAAMRTTTVLDRGQYGWCEYVRHLPCPDDIAAHQFYFRAGMLLCLLHVMRATDAHWENVIAHGEHPVLVDAETLLFHEPVPLDSSVSDESFAEHQLENSVLRTGLLPMWQFDGERGAPYDVSGLGGGTDPPPTRVRSSWHAINTDAMELRTERVQRDVWPNVPRLGARPLSATDHQTNVISGFEQMYRFVMTHRAALLAAQGPLTALRNHGVRFICRPTRVYDSLLATSGSPELLRSGIDYGIHLEQLARAFLTAPEKPGIWPLCAAEVRAIEQMDVPLFHARGDDTAIRLDDGSTVAGALKYSGYDAMTELVGRMGETDLAAQRAIIQGAFHAKTAHVSAGNNVDPDLLNREAQPLLPADYVREAVAIGLAITQRAQPDGSGCNWIGFGYVNHADRFHLQVLNDSLYDGCAGVSLFLAALYRVTGEPQFAAVATRGLETLRQRLRNQDQAYRNVMARLRGIGGGTGVGSTIYGLARTADFLQDEGILRDAVNLSEWLTPQLIAADDRLDVLGGSAGAILSLLTLHDIAGSPAVLEKAVACGTHLLQRRIRSRAGLRVWRTVGNRPLTGFSHGAAGIAYALVRLYAATRNRAYLDAATEAIEFERKAFSTARANWPDYRATTHQRPTRYPVKWCHGAPGVALGRLGCRKTIGLAGIDNEIAIALRTTQGSLLQNSDYVCCGNFGRVEALLVAGRITGQQGWREAGERAAAALVSRAHRTGQYQLFIDTPGVFNPTFFQGLAGIGYQLLRLAQDDLPSVLIWE